MPDVTVQLTAEDQVTPTINKIKGEMASLEGQGRKGAGGGLLGEQLKELMSGIGYQVGLWNVGFMLASKATDVFTNAISSSFSEVKEFIQLQNRLVLSNKQAEETFGALKMAATAAGRSVADASKDFITLRSVGVGTTESIEMTKNFGQRLKESGVNITEIVAKTQLFKASFEDLVQLGLSGKPFEQLFQPAMEGLKVEAWKPYKDLRLNLEHEIDEQTLQDQVRMIDREMEATTRAINYEIQDRHRAIEYEMADRHRVAVYAEADEQRLHSRRMGLFAALPGTMEVLAGRPAPKGQPMGYLGAQLLEPELQRGLNEIQKETGITADQIREAMREGMSPGVVLQFAEAAREEQRILNQRQRETEEIQTQRGLQKESIQTERDLTAQRLAVVYAIQDQQLKMERDYTNERLKDEVNLVQARLILQLKANQLIEQDRRARATKEARAFGLPEPAGGGYGTATLWTAPPEQQMRKITPEEAKDYQKSTDMVDRLDKMLDQLETISRAFQ